MAGLSLKPSRRVLLRVLLSVVVAVAGLWLLTRVPFDGDGDGPYASRDVHEATSVVRGEVVGDRTSEDGYDVLVVDVRSVESVVVAYTTDLVEPFVGRQIEMRSIDRGIPVGQEYYFFIAQHIDAYPAAVVYIHDPVTDRPATPEFGWFNEDRGITTENFLECLVERTGVTAGEDSAYLALLDVASRSPGDGSDVREYQDCFKRRN